MTFYQPGDPGSGHWSPEVAREQREEAFAPGAGLVQACPLPGLTSISCVSSPSPPFHVPNITVERRGPHKRRGTHSSSPGPCVQGELLSSWEVLRLQICAVTAHELHVAI